MSFRKKAISTFLDNYKQNSTGSYPTPFCFVLGAGASVSSGIESGQALVRKWDKELEEDDPEGHEEWKKSLNITDENKPSHYSDYYVRKFNEEPNHGFNFLADMMEKAKPSIGYMVLGHILKDTTCKVVVTTNFDHLTEDAITDFCHVKSTVIGHEALAEFGSHDTARPLIVKLHRDFKYKPKSTLADTSVLDKLFEPLLDDIFSHCHPVFIGYAGNDNSLMDFLIAHKADFKDGGKWKCPYWIAFDPEGSMKSKADIRSKLEKKILDFIEDDTGYIIPSEYGFDDIMFLLAKKLNIGLPSEEEFLKDAKDLYATLKGKWAEKANKFDNKQTEKEDVKAEPPKKEPPKKEPPKKELSKSVEAVTAESIAIIRRTPPHWTLKDRIDSGSSVYSVALTNNHIVSGDSFGRISIWDINSGERVQTLKEHTDVVRCLAVFQDDFIVSGSVDKSLRIWNPYSGKCTKKFGTQVNHGPVNCVAVAESGNIISGSEDCTIRIWNSKTGNCWKELLGHNASISSVVVTPSGRIVSSSYDRTIRIWGIFTGSCLKVIDGNGALIKCLAITNDGRIVSGFDDAIRSWDPSSGSCIRTLLGHTDLVNCLAVAPNGNIISGSNDKTVRIWDPDSGDCLQVLGGHIDRVTCLAVSTDGRIVSGSSDGTIHIWAPKN